MINNTYFMVDKSFYEVFEIHTTTRGVYILTLRINKENAKQYYQGRDKKIPVGTLTVVISKTEEAPSKANFLIIKNIGWNTERVFITKSFRTIHKRVNALKEAFAHPNLKIIIEGTEIPPYVIGTRYSPKGLYLGIKDGNIRGKAVKYHYFHDNVTGYYKEYLTSHEQP